MRDSLQPFSFAVLGLVGRGGASAHDIVTMMRRGRAYWSTSESHFYAEPKRLEQLGYLAAEMRPGKTTERRFYTLTPRGREALERWLAEPTGFPRIQSEAAIRLLASDLGEPAAVRASLLAMRSELDELARDLEENRALARTLPHREQALGLLSDLGQRIVDAHRGWLDEVERELAP